ncbi:MAG: CopG family transcriptional regulator [Caulobacteraceae bacterium]|nr:CopG family transcriptional regulator [Caulobacteraceae bacterium]
MLVSDSTILTVRLAAGVKDQLGELAELTHRSRSFLSGEAIGAFVRRELRIVAGIERGREDMRRDRLVDHDAAMDELDAEIDSAGAAPS